MTIIIIMNSSTQSVAFYFEEAENILFNVIIHTTLLVYPLFKRIPLLS